MARRDDNADGPGGQVRQIARATRSDEDVGSAAAKTAEVLPPLGGSQGGMPDRDAVAPPAQEFAQRLSGANDVVEHDGAVPSMLIHDLGGDL